MRAVVALSLLIIIALSACRKGGTTVVQPKTDTSAVITTPPVFVDNRYHKDGDVNKLYYNSADGVNIVVLGDGFTKEDLLIDGNFDKQAKMLIDYLLSVPPFLQYKQQFNVYTVYTESSGRGATKGYSANNTNSAFNSYFDLVTARLLIPGNYTKAYQYGAKTGLSKIHLLIMLVNDATYGGSGGAIATVSTHSLSKYIMVHEIGHTFAGLGDEYVDLPIANNYPLSQLPAIPNVDDTNDLTKIKWAHFLSIPAYQSLMGAFEGAYYRTPGYYRPELHSCMESLNYANFNAPSREAIAKRICALTGATFDFQAFVTADAGFTQPVRIANVDPALTLPRNDFINMQERLQQLQAETQTLQKRPVQ